MKQNYSTKPLIHQRVKGSNTTFDKAKVRDFDWLVISNDGGWCRYCKLFCNNQTKPKKAGELLITPYTSYSHTSLLIAHATTKYHQRATESKDDFIKYVHGQRPDIRNVVSGNVADERSRMDRLVGVIKTLAFLSRQAMAIRGHSHEKLILDEKFSTTRNGDLYVCGEEVNRGNFIETLKLRLDSGDDSLRNIANKKAHYYSPAIQNELLNDMASQIRKEIISPMKSKPFTIIADETTDVSNKEQLCIALRFVDQKLDATEKFLCLTSVASLKG